MSTTAIYSVSKKSGREVTVYCSCCGNSTVHKYIYGYDEFDQSPDGDMQAWTQYYIIQCQGCRNVSFLKEHQFSEDIDYETGQLENTQTIYPISLDHKVIIHDTSDLPRDISIVYDQILSALANDLYILASAGMRLIMEAVVKDKEISGADLQDKINNLAKAGHVPANGIPILQKIRIFGNQAIHDLSANTKKELLNALRVIEFMLLSAYVVPASADGLAIKKANWEAISQRIGDKIPSTVDVAALESAIKLAFNGGKLDVAVNPDAVKDLIKIVMSIGKGINFFDWQRKNILKAVELYVSEVKE